MHPYTSLLTRERSLYTSFSDRALEARRGELARLQEQLSTGRRVNRASDAPPDFALAQGLEALQSRYEQYGRSIDAARLWVHRTQDALDGMVEAFTAAYEEGLRLANSTFSADDREALAGHLESLRGEVLSRLNARSGSEYLFAGSRSTLKPFEPAGTAVTYTGNDGDRSRQIGPDLRLQINLSGADVWDAGGFTITDALQDLIDAARTGDPADIDDAFGRVVAARDHIVSQGAEAGAIGARLNLAEHQLREGILLAEGRRSELVDADAAETMMHLQREQTHLQAALQVTAQVMQISLLDFLR